MCKSSEQDITTIKTDLFLIQANTKNTKTFHVLLRPVPSRQAALRSLFKFAASRVPWNAVNIGFLQYLHNVSTEWRIVVPHSLYESSEEEKNLLARSGIGAQLQKFVIA